MTDLADHNGEGKHAHEVVDELEADLEDGGGVRESSDGDQRLHSEIVAANISGGDTTDTWRLQCGFMVQRCEVTTQRCPHRTLSGPALTSPDTQSRSMSQRLVRVPWGQPGRPSTSPTGLLPSNALTPS